MRTPKCGSIAHSPKYLPKRSSDRFRTSFSLPSIPESIMTTSYGIRYWFLLNYKRTTRYQNTNCRLVSCWQGRFNLNTDTTCVHSCSKLKMTCSPYLAQHNSHIRWLRRHCGRMRRAIMVCYHTTLTTTRIQISVMYYLECESQSKSKASRYSHIIYSRVLDSLAISLHKISTRYFSLQSSLLLQYHTLQKIGRAHV